MSGPPVALVTGATGGIGRALSRALVRKGYRVVLAVRDPGKAEPLLQALRAEPRDPPAAETPAAEMPTGPETLLLDLASPASVRDAADAFLARHDRLDLLVLNAGTFSWSRARTADGLERTLAVNLLGPAALADRLVPLLAATAARTGDARIVSTTSVAASWGIPARSAGFFRRAPGFLFAYSASKLGQVLHMRALAEELAGTGVSAACFDPGLVATGIFTGRTLFSKAIDAWMRRHAASPEEGAAPGVRLATDPSYRGRSGLVLRRDGEKRLPRRMRDPASARRLLAAVRAAMTAPLPGAPPDPTGPRRDGALLL